MYTIEIYFDSYLSMCVRIWLNVRASVDNGIKGLLLVPNGEDLGYAFGDVDPHMQISAINLTLKGTPHRSTASQTELSPAQKTSHPWGIFFTVLGTVLLDFDADACQSPSRAYLLDVCVPEDHAKGLSTFTIMAGLGGFMGYSMGGINWDVTTIGRRLGGHVKAVFTIITFIFIACVSMTVTSLREIPLWALTPMKSSKSFKSETNRLKDASINYRWHDSNGILDAEETDTVIHISFYDRFK